MSLLSKIKRNNALRTIQAYKRVFSSEDGRIILKDMAKKCFVFEAVTTKDGKDISMFNDGKRAVFIDICNVLNFDETELIKLIKEDKNG